MCILLMLLKKLEVLCNGATSAVTSTANSRISSVNAIICAYFGLCSKQLADTAKNNPSIAATIICGVALCWYENAVLQKCCLFSPSFFY